MNFAEAAMLIQGSVCVYSKKVCITLLVQYIKYFLLMYMIKVKSNDDIL